MAVFGFEGEEIFRTRDEIVAEILADIQTRIPDFWVEEDGVGRIVIEGVASESETVLLQVQALLEDTFPQSAGLVALRRHADQYGVPRIAGTRSTGSLLFSGAAGEYIPLAASVSTDQGVGEPVYFSTTQDGTIPSPGVPTAPTIADAGSAGNLTGLFEYAITFVTAGGETMIGIESAALSLAGRQMALTNIPLGGTGTTQRKIYRSKDGGEYKFVATLANNTSTTYTDNITDGALGGNPPTESTAERITLTAQADEPGLEGNATTGTIIVLSDVPDGITGVTNVGAFSGGTEEETIERFRERVLERIRNPQTGSPSDLEQWAEEIAGVDQATAFQNDNMGVATNGHTTVRIAGPGGAVPNAATINEVFEALVARNIANITIHVTTFVAVPTAVTVDVTTAAGTLLADVSPNVVAAISEYINSVPVSGTLYRAGIIDVIMEVNGVVDVTVSVPAANVTAAATEKLTVGVVTVT